LDEVVEPLARGGYGNQEMRASFCADHDQLGGSDDSLLLVVERSDREVTFYCR
jgi:hypothetical protein